MDLKIGKTYHVFYEGNLYGNLYEGNQDTSGYDGPAKLLGVDADEDDNGDSLHFFELMDGDGGVAFFSESDIVQEIS
jgi:hypothetical protein